MGQVDLLALHVRSLGRAGWKAILEAYRRHETVNLLLDPVPPQRLGTRFWAWLCELGLLSRRRLRLLATFSGGFFPDRLYLLLEIAVSRHLFYGYLFGVTLESIPQQVWISSHEADELIP